MTADTPNSAAPDTIVPVHGFWVTPRSWEKWVERYEGKGYRVLAPAYPGLEVEALREDPSPIEALTIPAIVEHYEGIIGDLESPRSSWATRRAGCLHRSCSTTATGPRAWRSTPCRQRASRLCRSPRSGPSSRS
jgi:hypothetical protein